MSSQKKYPELRSFKACVFCNTTEDDETIYGKFFHKRGISVHQNCMFFSSGLAQQSSRKLSGICGFKTEDIQIEVLRGKKLRCSYCKDPGATVGCCIGSCRKSFHFPCGKKNGSLHQHFGSFNSFCELHKPVQERINTPRDSFQCHICFSLLSKTSMEEYLYSTCCKNSWYHITCLQQYATSAGRHFFKCPKCKNCSDFLNEMEYFGISIPEKDASWELEENAYHDLLFRPRCGALNCKCDEGRSYDRESMWELLPCKLCGSSARHRSCESLASTVECWTCSDCKQLEDQYEINKIKNRMRPEVTAQDKSSDKDSTAVLPNDCKPSCSSTLTFADPSLTSVSDLQRALRCIVQVTPIKIVIDVNGISKPVLNNDLLVKSKTVMPFEIFFDNDGKSKSELNKNSNTLKGEQKAPNLVSSTSTNRKKKSVENKVKENKKRKESLDESPNIKVRLQEKAINTLNNDPLIKETATVPKVSVKLNASRNKSGSKKSKPRKKLTKCCSNETCISKFFGFQCPKLKNNIC